MSLVTQLTTLATRISTEFNAIRTMTGALTNLNTTNKTNLVSAINEAATTGGSGTGPTNLTTTAAPGSVTINSDTGTDATISPADGTNAGVFLPAEKTKLSGIATGADVTSATTVGSAINGASSKATPIDADLLPTVDTEASNVLKKVTVGSLKNLVIAAIQAGAPATLDTIDELAAALGDDPNAITTITTALGNRVRVDTATQGLSGTQQTNARTNIAAAGSAEVGDTTTDFVAVFEAGLA